MLAPHREASARLGWIDGGGAFEPLGDRELVETAGGGWLLVAIIIIAAAAVGLLIGAAAYVFTH